MRHHEIESILTDGAILHVATECLALKRELAERLTERDIVLDAVADVELEDRVCRDAVMLQVMELREALRLALAELQANRTAISSGMLGRASRQ